MSLPAASSSQRIVQSLPFVEALARRMASSMPHSIDIGDRGLRTTAVAEQRCPPYESRGQTAESGYEQRALRDPLRPAQHLTTEREARMERSVSIIRSDLAYAAGLRNPLVTAR